MALPLEWIKSLRDNFKIGVDMPSELMWEFTIFIENRKTNKSPNSPKMMNANNTEL